MATAEGEAPVTNGVLSEQHNVTSSDDPSTPPPPSQPAAVATAAAGPESSQLMQSSIEGSQSPGADSVKTELNDDRHAASTVIPSSLTPPPSTQPVTHSTNPRRNMFSQTQSQQSNIMSPPATIQRAGDHRDVGSDYMPPDPQKVGDAAPDEMLSMLQTCIAEHHKLKMETAHYKLQYNLLSMQAENDAKRAAVEHEMTRREVEVLRTAEHSRQVKRELSIASESMQAKYLEMKMVCEDVMEENAALHARVKSAKRVIADLQDKCEQLDDDRQMYINRIRENRERFHMLTSPGGMFHAIASPKNHGNPHTPRQQQQQHRRDIRRAAKTHDAERTEHSLSALLQVLNQDDHSVPTTPHRGYAGGSGRPGGRHHRNSMSTSALPSTPMNSVGRDRHDGSLLPSIDLVPQTEPPRRHADKYYADGPSTPTHQQRHHHHRKSRESTISESDNEELARQALESVAATHPHPSSSLGGSQASQAATELLRKGVRQSFPASQPSPSRSSVGASPSTKLLPGSRGGAGAASDNKRKFSGAHDRHGEARTELPQSPGKKRRVGLGIQFGQ